MKLGTSARFVVPTSPATHERSRSLRASRSQAAFIERPMGAYAPAEQARNLMEVAAAAHTAGLDALVRDGADTTDEDLVRQLEAMRFMFPLLCGSIAGEAGERGAAPGRWPPPPGGLEGSMSRGEPR